MRFIRFVAVGWLAGLLLPLGVSAHAFGQNYVLPLPAWLYIYAGAVAVALSFVVMGLFLNEDDLAYTNKTVALAKRPLQRLVASRATQLILRTFGLLLLALIIITGAAGQQPDAGFNFSSVFFWIIFLLGFTYLVAIIGNVWPAVSPLRSLTVLIRNKPLLRYPPILGYLPALVLYFFLIYQELSGAGASPPHLSLLVICYVLANLFGVALFGKIVWFRYFEFFEVFFRLVGKLSPFTREDGKLKLATPQIVRDRKGADHFTLVVFIMLMLSSTAFDGFRSTTIWITIQDTIFKIFPSASFAALEVVGIALLFVALIIFTTVYMLAIGVMRLMVGNRYSWFYLAKYFAYSLIPVAVAYNFAHYFPLLLVQGQSIIPIISDPALKGWDIFGTADYAVNVGLIPADAVWNMQVGAIVIGHIAGIYAAHVAALRLFKKGEAHASQFPMVAVMVIFTIAGLWILSQPLSPIGK